MNYLAHAYLSFHQKDILVGNMISDFVKGRRKLDYSPEIQNGINLHRLIDSFTDSHPVTKEAKEIFRPVYRLYSGSFVDVIYDHFLAIDQGEFNEQSLMIFTEKTYNTLDDYSNVLPDQFSYLYPYMKTQNWLYNYRYRQGIQKSLGGVVRRAKYLTESDSAYNLFIENYEYLKSLYHVFFPEVKSLSLEFLKDLEHGQPSATKKSS